LSLAEVILILKHSVKLHRYLLYSGVAACPGMAGVRTPYWDGTAHSSILILLASCQQTCMTYTVAVCTVKNS